MHGTLLILAAAIAIPLALAQCVGTQVQSPAWIENSRVLLALAVDDDPPAPHPQMTLAPVRSGYALALRNGD